MFAEVPFRRPNFISQKQRQAICSRWACGDFSSEYKKKTFAFNIHILCRFVRSMYRLNNHNDNHIATHVSQNFVVVTLSYSLVYVLTFSPFKCYMHAYIHGFQSQMQYAGILSASTSLRFRSHCVVVCSAVLIHFSSLCDIFMV